MMRQEWEEKVRIKKKRGVGSSGGGGIKAQVFGYEASQKSWDETEKVN